ncbi:hypothetical protein [Rhizohabitans arisaemae]|uniref:hypothetical protein n=1 Tax=Rhizohabitans arisaemae TaxID=2720610 RepID=UPI0024B0D8A8|nr:hypothetical protein [Rhizohabitans arisaemae]
MNSRTWIAVAALAAGLLGITSCAQDSTKSQAVKNSPVTVESTGQDGVSRVKVTQRAAERLGITLAAVRSDGSGLALPYSSIVYDSEGLTWVYTNPEPLVYVRARITADRVEGETAYVTTQLSVGISVVTTGAAELFGAELGIGK